MARRLFGASTRFYHRERLSRDHLLAIAARGFEAIEVLAARGHFDAANPAAVADLQQWMAEAGLELPSVLVPLEEDAEQALLVARRIAVRVVVVQATTPRETAKAVERLAALAAPLQASIAVDSASMSPVGSLVHFVEAGVDARVGICLDFGAAARAGDLVEAIEAVAEHLVTVRAPVESAIDWPAALTAVQKIGYDGPIIFDAAKSVGIDALDRARVVREQMKRLLVEG